MHRWGGNTQIAATFDPLPGGNTTPLAQVALTGTAFSTLSPSHTGIVTVKGNIGTAQSS
jgi:hypothetical protein